MVSIAPCPFRKLEYSEAVAVAVAATQPGPAHSGPTGSKAAAAVVRLLIRLAHLWCPRFVPPSAGLHSCSVCGVSDGVLRVQCSEKLVIEGI